MKKMPMRALLMCMACLMITAPCLAEKKDTLVVSLGAQPIEKLNPACTASRQTLVLYHNWGDTLLFRDPAQKKIVPCLAESFHFIDPKTIEFKLKKGIRFHNGEPFSGSSVAFSLDLLKRPDSFVSRYLAGFEKVEVIDNHTIRVHISLPDPTVLDVIANILFIYPPDYYKKVGKDGFEKHPVGTGPYQFVSRSDASEVCFEANPHYFGGPKGKPAIPHLKAIILPEELLQIEALVSGRADLLRATNFYQEHVPFIIKNPHLKILSVPILRTCFVTMDATGRSGVSFFKDKRVRMAVNYAIDKDKIIQHGFNGYADRTRSVASPLHFGYEPDVRQYPYDPGMARALLKEAGYPNGFTVDFFAATNESAVESVVKELEAVGINVRLHWMGGQWPRFYEKFLQGELPMAFLTWGSYSIFDASAILNPFFMKDGPGCYGTTAEISDLLAEAGQTLDQNRRRELFSKAQKIIADQAFWVPLCTCHALSIMNRNLHFQPSYDEIDRYFSASWE